MVSLAVVTPSYAPDYQLCLDLRDSVTRLTPSDVVHHLVVPDEDLDLFTGLTDSRCRIWTESELLPKRIVSTPRINRAVRRISRLPASARVAAVNVRRPFPPIRGWILQQVLKASLAARVGCDVVLLLDSDVQLIRPVSADKFREDSRTVLYRKPGGVTAAMHSHVRWHAIARKLLGLPPSNAPLPDYISSFMAWDSAVVVALQQRLEQVNGRPWADVLAGQLHLSEWTLYGTFVDEVFNQGGRGPHRGTPLCHEYWDPVPLSRESARAFVNDTPDTDLAIMISAKSRTPLDVRREALRTVAG